MDKGSDKMATVRIDLYGYGQFEDMWQGVFPTKNSNEVIKLFEQYDTKCQNGEYEGTWEDYLNYCNIPWSPIYFDHDDYKKTTI